MLPSVPISLAAKPAPITGAHDLGGVPQEPVGFRTFSDKTRIVSMSFILHSIFFSPISNHSPIMLVLPSTYIQILTTSHSFHCCHTLLQATIITFIDYFNLLLARFLASSLAPIQSLLNTISRVILSLCCSKPSQGVPSLLQQKPASSLGLTWPYTICSLFLLFP